MRKGLFASCAVVLVSLFLAPITASAAKPSEGCRFQGSWMGFSDGQVYWVSTAAGQSASNGTYVLEVPGFVYALPGVTGISAARGTWVRIDDYSFTGTVVTMLVGADGSTLYLAKVSAINTLSEDCNTMTIANTIELFFGFQNPFEDDPFSVSYPDPHTGFRMPIDPPAAAP
jgi:hypothetical protein